MPCPFGLDILEDILAVQYDCGAQGSEEARAGVRDSG